MAGVTSASSVPNASMAASSTITAGSVAQSTPLLAISQIGSLFGSSIVVGLPAGTASASTLPISSTSATTATASLVASSIGNGAALASCQAISASAQSGSAASYSAAIFSGKSNYCRNSGSTMLSASTESAMATVKMNVLGSLSTVTVATSTSVVVNLYPIIFTVSDSSAFLFTVSDS
jgi:hypothetical protein